MGYEVKDLAEFHAMDDVKLAEAITKLRTARDGLRANPPAGDRREWAALSVELNGSLAAAEEEQRLRQPAHAPLTRPGPRGSSAGRGDAGGFTDMGEFMGALYKKSRGEGYDARLEPLQVRASVGETVPSEGGFAVPTMFVDRALNENLEDTVLLQLCDRQVMTTNEMTAPAFVDDNHSTTAPFGITWTMIAEAGSWGSLQGTPFRSMNLNARKAGALFLVSNEWLADASSGIRQRLENIWRASLRWFIEDLLWAGTGAGQPLGAIVGPGALSIPKETGQRADTILTENVVNMWARLRPGSHSRAIWCANASCFPNLATLSLSVGTGGAPISLLTTNQGAGIAGAPATAMLGRPLYLSEHLPAIGDAGDLVLCDPLLYLLGDRQQIVLDASPHVRFESDQTVFRGSARIDGQPIYSAVLTPKNGPTAGWLVKIAERA
jgi:HK97 family phage major capsid protein